MISSFDPNVKPLNTVIMPIVRSDLAMDALRSFWQFSDRETHRMIVIDQTMEGLPDLTLQVGEGGPLAHMHWRVYRNLGFAKAANYGLRIADTPLVMLCNDDVLFFDRRWWAGILECLSKDGNIGASPLSPRLPGWSIGKRKPEHTGGIDSREKCQAENVRELLEGAGVETVHDYLKATTNFKGYINGVCHWCVTFKRVQLLSEVGFYDENFFPGGGEDYDLQSRCAQAGYRVMGTWEAWVWHDWGRTKDQKKHDGMKRVRERPNWNRMGDLWEGKFDAWGRTGTRKPHVHVEPL